MSESMTAPQPTAREQGWQTQFDRGEMEAVATQAIQAYGPEILGMLYATCRSADLATEAYSQFCEDFWRGLPRFRWACTLRTWSYRLAHNARSRLIQKPSFQKKKNVPLSAAPGVFIAAEAVRTQTMPYLRTTMKKELSDIRADLQPDEQELLILRLDRRYDWAEIALIMADTDPDNADLTPDKETLKADAAKLRKRYQRLKVRLKKKMLDSRT